MSSPPANHHEIKCDGCGNVVACYETNPTGYLLSAGVPADTAAQDPRLWTLDCPCGAKTPTPTSPKSRHYTATGGRDA